MASTTIQVSEELRDRLRELKVHPRQTYEEVIEQALDHMESSGVSVTGEART